MTDRSLQPATSLEDATAALDAERPLQYGDVRFEDLAPARGGDVTQRMRRALERKQPGRFKAMVFASHRGAGKSTELFRLAHDLRDRYQCLYLEANVEMDAQAIAMEDLVLVLAREVATLMQREGLPLESELLSDIAKWFGETIQTTDIGQTYVSEMRAEAGAGGAVAGFVKLMASMTALLRVESQHRETLKQVLRQYPGALMDAVNKLLTAAHKRLKDERGRELLVIIDNLDRYEPSVIDDLIVRHGNQLLELKCNLILTPPIVLIYRPETGPVEDYFKIEVMNAVRLRGPHDPPDQLSGPGRELLLAALNKRIDIARLIPEEHVRDRLIVASGGSIRDLLELTADATLEADGLVLTLRDIEAAARRRRTVMRDKMNSNGWADALATIARTKQIDADTACLLALYNRMAFKYNGDGWYDVHPLLHEIPEFLAALERTHHHGEDEQQPDEAPGSERR
ncbi:MAG: hypothetical protein R3F39_18955 [Myxococcota bacterium]